MTTNRLMLSLLILSSLGLGSFFFVYAQDDTDLDAIVNDVVTSTDTDEAEIARQKALEAERLRQAELDRQRAADEFARQKEIEAQQELARLIAEEEAQRLLKQQTASGSYELTIDESIRTEFKWYRAGVMARYPTLRQCIIPSDDAEKSMRIVCPRIGEYQITIDRLIGDYASRISTQDKTTQLIMLNARKEEINNLAPAFLSSIIVNEQSDGQLFIEYSHYMLDMYIWIADHKKSWLLPSLTQK